MDTYQVNIIFKNNKAKIQGNDNPWEREKVTSRRWGFQVALMFHFLVGHLTSF